MTPSTRIPERVQHLVDAACTSEVSPAEAEELESLLRADEPSRQFYAAYCRMHAELLFSICEKQVGRAAREAVRAPQIEGRASSLPVPAPISVCPPLTGYFASGWPAAYLIATVIFGVGLAIGAFVHVSAPTQVVQPSTPHSLPLPHDPSAVGQITGMVDCVWEGSGFRVRGSEGANQRSLLHLGDRLGLKSGLLEITYDTGAKVVLQGPVAYEVESAAGGYLSLGRLTATLEEKSEVRGQRSESANQKSEIRNHRSFAVRTPTALVTDLGTEFGVAVDSDENVEIQVFRGLVDVQRQEVGRPSGVKNVRLSGGEGVCIRRGTEGVSRVSADASQFPTIRRAASQDLVARYRFDEIVDSLVPWAPDSSGHRLAGAMDNMTRANVVSGKVGNAFAFNVADGAGQQCVVVPRSPALDFTDQSFSIALWLNRRAAGVERHEIILAKESFNAGACGGYAIIRDRGSKKLVFRLKGDGNPDWNAWMESGSPQGVDDAPEGEWVHFAVVCRRDPAGGLYDIQLYRNGVPGTRKAKVAMLPAPVALRFCSQVDGWAFRGLLDDVQMYRRALSDGEVKFLFTHPGSLAGVQGSDAKGEN